MRILTLLACLLAVFNLVWADGPSTDYLGRIEAGDKAAAEKNWQEARDAYQTAIIIEPDNPQNILLMSNIGLIDHMMGNDSIALITLNEAAKKAPKSVTILMNRATVNEALGHTQDAFNDYGKVMMLDSTYVQARYNHGLIALRNRLFNDAKEDFDYLQLHNPNTYEANMGQAALHVALGEYDKAVPFYSSILEDTKEAEIYAARGYCNLMAGNLQEASEDIGTAIEMDPTDGELYLYRAALNKLRYQPIDAKKDALRAIELGIDPARAAEFVK